MIYVFTYILLLFIFIIIINNTEFWLKLESNYKILSPVSFLKPIEFIKNNDFAIIIIHEYSGTPESLKYLGEKLSKNNFDVYIPAMPSIIDNENDINKIIIPPNFMLWYNYIQDYYLNLKNKYKKIFIIGASIGGSIGLKLAENYDIDGIITISSPLKLTGTHYRKKFTRNFMIYFSGLFALFTNIIYTGKLTEEARKIENFNGVEGIIWTKSLHHMKIQLRDVKKNLKKINSPILIFHALQDKTVDFKNSDIIMKNINSNLIIRKLFDLSNDQITRCHRLANHLWVRDELFYYIENFLNLIINRKE